MSPQAIPQQDGVFGNEQLASSNDPFNEIMFIIQSVLTQVNVATLVKVKAVNVAGRISPVGTVDVVPLVNQVTGDGLSVPHTTVYGLPYFRLQGGASGVICDPVVGDMGIALFCDRDISGVKNQPASALSVPGALPSTGRRWSFADGVYFGGWGSTVTPTKAIILDALGCEITSDVKVDGNTNVTGNYQVNGTRVVTSRQANIANPIGGATVDANARVTIASILSLLQTHGLMT